MNRLQLAHRLEYSALAIAGLLVAFWLFMGFGEMAGGDFSGIGHVLPALAALGLLGLAWKHPRAGGWALLGAGLLVLARFAHALLAAPYVLFITAGPLIVAGALLLWAAQLEQKDL